MKIAPASALAVWAIGTVWLLTFYVLERYQRQIGDSLTDVIQLAGAILGLALYRPIRKMFTAWLAKNR